MYVTKVLSTLYFFSKCFEKLILRKSRGRRLERTQCEFIATLLRRVELHHQEGTKNANGGGHRRLRHHRRRRGGVSRQQLRAL